MSSETTQLVYKLPNLYSPEIEDIQFFLLNMALFHRVKWKIYLYFMSGESLLTRNRGYSFFFFVEYGFIPSSEVENIFIFHEWRSHE